MPSQNATYAYAMVPQMPDFSPSDRTYSPAYQGSLSYTTWIGKKISKAGRQHLYTADLCWGAIFCLPWNA